MPLQVAVCGPRNCPEADWAHAYEVGRLLAEREAVLVCGGHGGVMAAAAAGARSSGGIVVGVLPDADRVNAGPDLTVAIPTGLGEARNNVIVNAADAVIVVGGSWGTLSELALAMRAGRAPVVQLGGWRVLDEQGRPLSGIRHAATPQEALALTGLWA
ncbi:TIGR00725 family protein [Actinomadura barringtoniae]|uniref:TIGR00725 family protein n=1 Tax=Actinomadura barringtoniae TaxID=1427535 RepID=A0A939PTA3_9ACTN|nr:TIGR00725 family protein [Actinomadura barringtoniae]MBO2454669.1 TIGR00725 family protein [Actinomadura barringtoniae]